MFNASNSKKQGDIGLSQAIAWFVKEGYVVSIPLTDSQEYDLIVDVNNTLSKVQVKTTSYKSKYGIYSCGLRTLGGNRSGTGKTKFINKDLIDFVFIVTDEFTKYLIPIIDLTQVSNISLGDDKIKYIVT